MSHHQLTCPPRTRKQISKVHRKTWKLQMNYSIRRGAQCSSMQEHSVVSYSAKCIGWISLDDISSLSWTAAGSVRFGSRKIINKLLKSVEFGFHMLFAWRRVIAITSLCVFVKLACFWEMLTYVTWSWNCVFFGRWLSRAFSRASPR